MKGSPAKIKHIRQNAQPPVPGLFFQFFFPTHIPRSHITACTLCSMQRRCFSCGFFLTRLFFQQQLYCPFLHVRGEKKRVGDISQGLFVLTCLLMLFPLDYRGILLIKGSSDGFLKHTENLCSLYSYSYFSYVFYDSILRLIVISKQFLVKRRKQNKMLLYKT